MKIFSALESMDHIGADRVKKPDPLFFLITMDWLSTYKNEEELARSLPIQQNTKNKGKRNEEKNDGHSMMEQNVLAIYNNMAVEEQASIKRVRGSNISESGKCTNVNNKNVTNTTT